MSISGIHGTLSPYLLGTATNPSQQFQQLGQALQSGNLSAAQSDFATLQQAFSQSAAISGTTSAATANPVSQAFNQLASDLKSGNLSAAQQDYSTLQRDLQSTIGTLPTHRFPPDHYKGGISTGQLQDLNQIGQSLTSSNLAGAQQAYATLQQQLQQFALAGGALSTLSPVSLEA